MKTILMAALAGVFLVSAPFKAAQAEDKAPAAKETKGKKEKGGDKGDKKDDTKKDDTKGGGW